MSGRETLSLKLMSNFESVRDALVEIMGAIEEKLNAEKSIKVELALAEALNNIVEHAYKEADGHQIDVDIICDGSNTICTMIDTGVPNTSLANVEGTLKSPSEMAEGGYGNDLIRTLASRLEYNRDNGRNITKIWL